ncbi:transglycosylase domain-containing protein [endosymbiont of Pachyrhynchus infernalis]|uniref:transglycosylase domain-containing protein n=1 Tax=endosymbiont of Pachyrhynchus infernalis TaxID=1971488 RepID=UPI000DC6EFCC|nr:transglycosylase domain-containing protein [endosymbiont of Pachyrhynchus infernalis]BBA84814.1 penicillin-binding protein 1B [endosymbiont of Pachyrhynchus infernalis]
MRLYYNFKLYIIIFIILIIIKLYIIKINNFIDVKLKNNNFIDSNNIVYSKIININCKSNLNKKDIINILLLSKYKKKDIVNIPGEFSINNNILTLFKRSFNFYYGYEKETIFKIFFKENKLIKIKNINDLYVENINIDPNIISIINNNKKYKLFLPISNFPKTLINILIEIEDKNYFSHNGINIKSIIRAIIKNVLNKKIIEGGSTITQQLVKNIFLTNKKSFLRKINEILISIILEYKLNKEKILELYLNEVYFGNINNKEIRGFPLGSICYFGKLINELDINEQAYLVGMLKGSSLYNPVSNFDLVKMRKNFILSKIKVKNIIDEELYNYLILKNNIFNNINNKINYPSFVNIVKKDINKLSLNNKNNLRIFSTLNLITQNNVQKSINISIKNLRKLNNNIEISMIVIDRKKGYIKSSIGGSNYNFDGYNRIFMNRQIGSLIKPFIYISALNIPNKFNLNTNLLDNKLEIKYDDNIWCPKNNDNKFRGNVTLMDSLIYSLNIPTINLGMNIGIDNIINNLIKFGIDKNTFINRFPSMLIGAINLSLIDIAQIYQSISNYGNFNKLSSIRYINDINNNIKYINKNKSIQVISPQSSYLTLFCMSKITKIGTASMLNKNFNNINILGKTGTTNKLKDSWFVGIDNNEICVIWVGNDNNSSINLNKLNNALHVYENYLKISNPESFNLIKPNDIYEINIDKLGNFLCNNHYDCNKIPIWIKNPYEIYNNCPKHSFIIKIIKKLINFN